MSALKELKRHLKPGEVYRRADLMLWSNAVDRHLKQLMDEGVLVKVSQGLYSYPKKASFGTVPAEDKKLVKSFLKSDDFLLFSPNQYNALGLGSTQLYNTMHVYNRKRHGRYKLAGRVFDFKIKPYYPKVLNKAFLLVDMLNNANQLAEDQAMLFSKSKVLAQQLNEKELAKALTEYGKVGTKKYLSSVFESRAV